MQVQSLYLDLDLCCQELSAEPHPARVTVLTEVKASPICSQRTHLISTFTHIGRRSLNLDTMDYIITDDYQLLAIYDGHGDAAVSNYLKQVLLSRLQAHPKLRTDFQGAALEVFKKLEQDVADMAGKNMNSGSTALVVFISDEKVTTVNLGDSRAILVTSEGGSVQINEEHTLTNPAEHHAVTLRGGLVLKRGNIYRINGELNVSRSFGDNKLKPYLSSIPQFNTVPIGSSSFLVVASDGFWQNTSNAKVAKEVAGLSSAQGLAKKLYQTCSPKAADNATLICVSLR